MRDQDSPSKMARAILKSGPSDLAVQPPIVVIVQQHTCLAQIRGTTGLDVEELDTKSVGCRNPLR